MEYPGLRESTSRLGQRMRELDRSINGFMIGSSLNLLLYFVGLAKMLALSRSPSMTCRFVWMPFLLSLVTFAVSCHYLYYSLRRLWTYSAEMERVAVELNKGRRRLLELGMEHDAFLADMAGIWAVPAWIYLIWGVVNPLCFMLLSVPLIYAKYTC